MAARRDSRVRALARVVSGMARAGIPRSSECPAGCSAERSVSDDVLCQSDAVFADTDSWSCDEAHAITALLSAEAAFHRSLMATPAARDPLRLHALFEVTSDRAEISVEALQHAMCSRPRIENDGCQEMFGTEMVMSGTPCNARRSLQVPSRFGGVGRTTCSAEFSGELVHCSCNAISRQATSLEDGGAQPGFEQSNELMVGPDRGWIGCAWLPPGRWVGSGSGPV